LNRRTRGAFKETSHEEAYRDDRDDDNDHC
jgi:hypothetical protein